jgi:hypothetical protein
VKDKAQKHDRKEEKVHGVKNYIEEKQINTKQKVKKNL